MTDEKTRAEEGAGEVDNAAMQEAFEAAFNAALRGEEPEPAEEAESASDSSEDAAAAEPEVPAEEPQDQAEGEAPESEPEEADDAGEEPSAPSIPLSSLDEETVKTLLAKSAKVDMLEEHIQKQQQELRRAYGKIGELNSHIKKLMKEPSQRAIKQAELKFERLREEFPELAELLAQDLAEALNVAQNEVDAGERGEPADEAPQVPDEALSADEGVVSGSTPETGESFEERERRIRAEYELKLLSMRHPDWQQIATSPDFQIWLVRQPQEVQQIVRTSMSADELAKVLDDYKASVAAPEPAKPAVKQSKRLESAVTPVNTTSAPPPPSSDERDEFIEGFKAVMQQYLT